MSQTRQHRDGWFQKRQQEQGNLLERTAVVWKSALGSIAAWEVASWTTSAHPYLAPLTLILCLQATIGQSIKFAWQRSLGTVIGVILLALFAPYLPTSAWMLGLILLVSTGVTKAIGLNDVLIHQIALSVLFVWYFEVHSPGYAWDRVKDTLIGAAMAILFMTVILPPSQTKPAAAALRKCIDELTILLDNTAEWLDRGFLSSGAFDALRQQKKVRQLFQQTLAQLTQAAQSDGLNPYANRQQTQATQAQFEAVQSAYGHFVELSLTLRQWNGGAAMAETERVEWSQALHAIADWIRAWHIGTSTQTAMRGTSGVPHVPGAPRWPRAQALDEPPYAVLAHYEALRLIYALRP